MQTTAQERAARIVGRLDALFEIGRAAGTNRPGLGAGEQRAHDLVAGWMRDAGLEVSVDRAGNLFGRAAGAEASRACGARPWASCSSSPSASATS